jgi:hypothetical protein
MLILLKLSTGAPTNEEQQQIEKITTYLKENKQPYMIQVNQGESEVPEISLGNILTEVGFPDDAEQFIGFLARLGVPKHEICVINQVSFMRGDGKQLYDYFPFNMSLNEFTQQVFGENFRRRTTSNTKP